MKLLHSLRDLLFHGVYPNICLLCDHEIVEASIGLCSLCKNDLPYTFIAENSDKNPVKEIFRSRIDLVEGYSLLFFEKQTDAQKLLHQLKYRDKANLGITLGKMIGKDLLQTQWIGEVDCLIPVPIHPKKMFIRGYNQSHELAKGIQDICSISVDVGLLKRVIHQESQTQQNRFDRHGHIQHSFSLSKKNFPYRHIALVDDVITTGATLERIASLLLEQKPTLQISVITLAIAKG